MVNIDVLKLMYGATCFRFLGIRRGLYDQNLETVYTPEPMSSLFYEFGCLLKPS